jgi:hypothetical protein
MPVQNGIQEFNNLDSGFRRNDAGGAPSSFNEIRVNDTGDKTEAMINPGSDK